MSVKTYPWKKPANSSTFPVYFIMGSQQFHEKNKAKQIDSFIRVLEEACQHGIDFFQFRDKDHTQLSTDEQYDLAKQAQAICQKYKVPFFINDNIDMAIALQADGIHIGQGDQNAAQVRQAIGPDVLLGVSAHETDQVKQAIEDGADYVGCGPVFTTASKANVRPAIGAKKFRALQAVNPDFPVFAIGGIHHDNIAQVHAMNPDAICVISEIAHADDVAAAIHNLKIRR